MVAAMKSRLLVRAAEADVGAAFRQVDAADRRPSGENT